MSKNKRKRKNIICGADVVLISMFPMFWFVIVKCSSINVQLHEQIGLWLSAMAGCYVFHLMFKAYSK